MPIMFRFYIKHCAIGFAVAAVFVTVLLYFNVANLWHLIRTSDVGVMALFVFWMLNGIVFAGVQTGVAVMLMSEDVNDDDGPRCGHGAALKPVTATASPRDGIFSKKSLQELKRRHSSSPDQV